MNDRKLFQQARTTLAALVLAGLMIPAVAPAQSTGIEGEITAVETRLQNNQAANLALLAPKSFGEAKEKLADAKEKFARGGKIDEIRAKLREVTQKLDEAAKVESVGNLLLADAITARADALEANAPEYAAKLWEDANSAMYEAGREVEKGNQNEARKKAAQAVERYRTAELEAIRANLLGAAQDAKSEALGADADEKAPKTVREGETLLDNAEKILRGDRYQRTEAKDQARRAADAFRHATYLASLVDKVGEKNKGKIEELVLTYENVLAQVAGDLNVDPDFSLGVGPVGESVLSALASLKTDRKNLQADIHVRDGRLQVAAARIDSLDAALATLEQRERKTSAIVEQEQQRQNALKTVHQMFLKDEAEVLLDGDDLIIRLKGLSFPVGSSEIQPANFGLLTKLQRVLRIYPTAPVTIAGHTDAQGDDDFNRALSMRRAEAVRSYLVANMGSDADRFEALGFGESQPIANNETAAGRALNRRIDVKVNVSGS